MKTKSTLLVLFVLGGLLFNSGCKKEAENIIDSIKTNIDVKINGDQWRTETVTSTTQNNTHIISAIKGTESLIISLTDFAVGTYPIDLTNNTAIFTNGTDLMKNIYTAGSGEVKITGIIKDGKEFEGTFSFITINASGDVKTFTSGVLTNILLP